MVHVLDLLGCIACGPTTEAALERTPRAIWDYLCFLRRHGEVLPAQAQAQADITTQVAEHITEGLWLGNGDPTLLFAPDKEPLTRQDLETCLRRLTWSRTELVALLRDLSEEQMEAMPPRGRSIRGILEHVFSAEYSYVRRLGKLANVRGPGLHMQRAKEELLAWMAVVRASEISRLRMLADPPQEEAGVGNAAHNVRRLLRRLLEHEWEHLQELRERLQAPLA